MIEFTLLDKYLYQKRDNYIIPNHIYIVLLNGGLALYL